MRSYTTNILPTDAAYYKASNAIIVGNQIRFSAGGTVSISLDKTQLATMTEYFRVTALAAPPSDAYTGTLTLLIHAKAANGKYFTHFCNLNMVQDEVFSEELEFIAEEYEFFTLTYSATTECTLFSWELCPEASDGDIQVVIDGVKQSLPRLLYDYNTTEVTIEQAPHMVGMIHCYLIDNTDLQGHFTMTFTASEYATVHVRFLDNNMVELFSPMLFTVLKGLNTIGIPHAYLNKLAGIHNFCVTVQVTNGYLKVPIRSMLYTIDGGYLASRLMDPGMNVMDLSIRQLPNERSPSQIWCIGIDNDIVIVKRRSYDISKYNEAWQAVYNMGTGRAAAIEFDGNWVLRHSAENYTLETEEIPKIAIVDMEKNLYVYMRATKEDPIFIDSDVDYISMVRGYKSSIYLEQDQGVILCYVKGGNVYYKQYAYFQGSYTWLPTELFIDTGDVLTANVQRLNDYRVGFSVTTQTENHWYISDRTYVGQSFIPETVHMRPRVDVTIGLLLASDLPDDLTATAVLSETRKRIIATFNHPIRCTTAQCEQWMTIPDELRRVLESISVVGSQMIIVVKEPLKVPYTITLLQSTTWQYYFDGRWLAFRAPVSFQYDPYVYQEAYNTEAVTLKVTQMTSNINLIPVNTMYHSQNENVQMDIAAMEAPILLKSTNPLPYTIASESANFDVVGFETSIVLTLVGESPI